MDGDATAGPPHANPYSAGDGAAGDRPAGDGAAGDGAASAADDRAATTTGDGAPWSRLDARMLAVAPAQQVVRVLPFALIALIAGRDSGGRWFALATVVLLAAYGVMRWLTTRYRVTAERVEVRTGVLFRQHKSVPRDRVRTVDIKQTLLHRVFGLSVLSVGTGQRTEPGKDSELALDAVTAGEAERLRVQLLDRSPVASPGAAAGDAIGDAAPGAGPDGAAGPDGGPAGTATGPAGGGPARGGPADTAGGTGGGEDIARIDWRWLRFAPLTLLGLAAIGALVGVGFQVLNELEVDPTDIGLLAGVWRWVEGLPLVGAIVSALAIVLVLATLGSVVLYVEAWWGYHLSRLRDGTLRVNRGLLTKRSVSLEERRLRGVEVVEPMLLRAGRGARTAAVATGSGDGDRASLLPPAPRAIAHGVGADVLRVAEPPSLTPLVRHPRVALRRRLVRALTLPALVAGGLGVPAALTDAFPWWPAGLAAALLVPVALLLGVDRYRNLGHVLTDEFLVVRGGSALRQTVVLSRAGIIGWRVRQSVLQRRAGIATATAVTAAGAGHYEVVDLAIDDATRLAVQLTGVG